MYSTNNMSCITLNGKAITDSHERVATFNEYFISIATNITNTTKSANDPQAYT